MGTITLGNVGQPEAVEKGDNCLICHISLSVSLSVGDVHIVGRIPHGSIPLDAVWFPGAAFAATGIAKFGTSASQELYFASDSWAESGTLNYRTVRKLGTAMQLSLSDDAMPRYENVVMVGTAGISIGHVGDLIIYYKMPGQTL